MAFVFFTPLVVVVWLLGVFGREGKKNPDLKKVVTAFSSPGVFRHPYQVSLFDILLPGMSSVLPNMTLMVPLFTNGI